MSITAVKMYQVVNVEEARGMKQVAVEVSEDVGTRKFSTET